MTLSNPFLYKTKII